MNIEGSISDFFYNIVPGIIFIFFLNYCYGFDVVKIFSSNNKDSAVVIFIYIVVGLFLGFLFQCFTKQLRSIGWNNIVFAKVRENNCNELEKICKEVLKEDYKKDKCTDKDKIFYLMDNYLSGREPAFLRTHFSSRFAFWANISWGAFVLIILGLVFHPNNNLIIGLMLSLAFSLWMAHEHLINFYDSILKSFYMTFKKDKALLI